MNQQVDHAEIKMGQVLTIFISVIALLTQNQLTLLILGGLFLLSGTIRSISPISLLYKWIILPAGIMKSDYRLDNIQAHQFGQLVGVLTVVLAIGLLQSGYQFAGWSVVVLLIFLTVISFFGWCIGCFMYYQLNRLGLGGFFKYSSSDKSVSLGMRAKKGKR